MNHPTSSGQRKSLRVVIWTIGWIVLLQGLTACLPGYPWPAHTQPELAVQAERYYRDGGWIRACPTLEESIIQWQVHHLLTEIPPQDVLFIGDSSCLMGIVPQRITELTGLPAWNLGTVGSLSTQGHARILDLYLRRHAASKPKLVVCVFAPPTLLRTTEQVEQLGVLNRFQEWLNGADAGQAAQAPLAQLPGYRLRRPLYLAARHLLSDARPTPLLDVQRGPFPSDDTIRQVLLKNRGYLPEPRRNRLSAQEVDTTPLLTPDSLAGIVLMFELTRSHEVEILFLMTPLPESHRTPETAVAFRHLEEQLREAAQPFPNVNLGTPLLRYFADRDFGTPHHLTETGAPKNSDQLARLIAKKLDE